MAQIIEFLRPGLFCLQRTLLPLLKLKFLLLLLRLLEYDLNIIGIHIEDLHRLINLDHALHPLHPNIRPQLRNHGAELIGQFIVFFGDFRERLVVVEFLLVHKQGLVLGDACAGLEQLLELLAECASKGLWGWVRVLLLHMLNTNEL